MREGARGWDGVGYMGEVVGVGGGGGGVSRGMIKRRRGKEHWQGKIILVLMITYFLLTSFPWERQGSSFLPKRLSLVAVCHM